MTPEIYLKCVGACLIGNILHIAFKIRSLRADFKQANMQFSLKNFIKDDWLALVIDFVFSFALIFFLDEFAIMAPWIMNKIKIIFCFIGFTGSYVILQLMSVTKNKFHKVVDAATNELDEIKSKQD